MKRRNSKEEKRSYPMFEGDRKLRTLVENLPGIVFRCENDSDRTMQFISNECRWITGYWPEEFCRTGGIRWASLIHPMDKDDVWNTVEIALAKNEKFQLKYRIIDKEGKIHWISETGVAVEKKEGTAFLEGYMQDITAQIMGGNINVIKERALDEVRNGIVIANAKPKQFPIIYVNKAFEKITGYTSEEVIGKNYNFLQSDECQQQEIQIIREALSTQSSCHVEIHNYKKDGTLFWNELSITPIRDLHGETSHFIVIQNDITERKNLELLRKAKNDVLEMIIKKKPLPDIFDRIQDALEQQMRIGTVAICLYDDIAQAIKRVSGNKIHPTIAKAMDQILGTSDACPCIRAIRSKKKESITDILEEPSWSKHQATLIEAGIKSIGSTPILDADDNIVGALSIFYPDGFLSSPQKEDLVDEMAGLVGLAIEQDKIRKRLQMNQERLEARSKGLEKQVELRNKDLEQILKELRATNFELNVQIADAQNARKRAEIQEAMLLAIAQKFPRGAIILVNEQMQISFVEGSELKFLQKQIRSNQELSINNLDGFSIKSKSLLLTCIKQTLRGKHLSFEIEYQKRNYIVNTTPLFIENGKASLALLVLFNISDRKRNEGKMLQNLIKERELSELKTQFISTASHEFRAPLSVILSSASLIEKLNNPDKGERRLVHLEKIKSNVRQLVNILNDFLSVTKLDEGETKASPEYFDLLHFSRSLIEKLKIGKKKEQSIILECEKAELVTFLDPKLMHLVLSNLLNNAIKYSDEDQPILLKIEDNELHVKLWVIDHGIGIPEDDQKHLFQRFFRAKNSVNIAGTGLGLHIVKMYVELMGGKIGFESKENHGSTFKLEFPKKHYTNEKNTGNRRS
ncbi:PAS domain S-box protein [Flagellimonas halotolerans]|uniref:histidine kinase n=1 Tax=Flagellimonas halotolerans TaxID=3112164 RepID=A0ABU6IPG4_9FLAO|nr:MULTISPECIES: PAS domain S-box protein [unclassified Allomuricauda]MEC3965151.1 PAS domain S-box protein [Muricauda sp. SYSU M86414]MEC4265004.1 PAS domain S-box protein [Muricauda sp. SYSU M84420]